MYLELNGKNANAKVFTHNIENEAISQIINILNQPFVQDETVRIMPDVHAGATCPIGFTMTASKMVVPNLVSGDIGCGMFVVELEEKKENIDFQGLDTFISTGGVPNGFTIFDSPIEKFNDLKKLIATVDETRANCSLGTLGGGNHYIELDEAEDGTVYLVIHTGSRHLGQEVCSYWQKKATQNYKQQAYFDKQPIIDAIVKKCTAENRKQDIEKEIKAISMPAKVPENLTYLEGAEIAFYAHDMDIAQRFAELNRVTIARSILHGTGLHAKNVFHTTHNYLDIKRMIIRKGAISAEKDEIAIIPLNMRDGTLIVKGKGNADWNYSAPHGAGRAMSRSKAKETVSLQEFKESMKGIYSTAILNSTIDESPMAYKPMEDIIDNIGETAEIISHIKPIYNFKAH